MEKKFIYVFSGAALIIIGFLLYAAYPTLSGTEIELRLQPVDPTDLFRGEYLTLSYDLSRIDDALQRDGVLKDGETIYVSLGDGRVRHATGYSHVKPAGLALKGVVDHGRILYGIERYYIPEGAGRDVSFWNKNYTARVMVDTSGNSRVTAILLDGDVVTFTYVGKE